MASSVDPLRVLHITSGLGLGGAEMMLFRMLRLFHENTDQRHYVLALTSGSAFDFSSIGVPVEVVDFKAGNLFAKLKDLGRVVRALRPDLVHGWMYHGNSAATLGAPLGVPVIWGIHHSLHDMRGERLGIRALIFAGVLLARLPHIRNIIYVSDQSRRHHAEYGYPDAKALTIANGFDCTEFAPDDKQRTAARAALGVRPDELLVGCFGRIHPVKDHALLLRAFARVAAILPNARLLLAGDGAISGNSALMAKIEANGLVGKVMLLGPRSDMPSLYRTLDIYVLCSKSESFPNVLGEASATGVPCVTTAVGDAPRIVGPSGHVVPIGDVAALASAMLRVLELTADERRGLGEAARAHVARRFGLPKVAEEYLQLYERLSRRHQGHRG